MKFIEYNIAKPPFDTRECQQRGLTYAAAVRAKLQMIVYDRESAQAKTVKEIKSRRSTWAKCPDDRLRLVHRQRHRARDRLPAAPLAGVFFEHDKGKTHSSGKLLFSARIIPYRGSWLDFEFDPRTSCSSASTAGARCRRRSCSQGDRPEPRGDPRALFRLRLDPADGHRGADGVRRRPAAWRDRGFDITDKDGNVVVEKDKRITARCIRR